MAENTEVYNILCDSLEIDPHPNNGTLRLPLKPIGVHSDTNAPSLDTPDDPPGSSISTAGPHSTPSTTYTSTAPATSSSASPTGDADSESESEGEHDKSPFEVLGDVVEGAVGSVGAFLSGFFGGGSQSEGDDGDS